MLKRIFDIITAMVGLLLLSPLFLLLMFLIYLKMGKPIFFTQVRPGKDEKLFTIYKFRSMANKKDGDNNLLSNRERLTPFGRFIRSISLDELPELINIIKGDMSLVGPRPLKKEYLPLYNNFQKRRHEIKPGLTGWAQVNGRNSISWNKKFELDVWYVDNHSLWLDIKIIVLTLIKVFAQDGINSTENKTMPKFKGSQESEQF